MAQEQHSGFTLTGDIEPNGHKYGSATTYILVDTTNNKIQLWVNGVLVQEFS